MKNILLVGGTVLDPAAKVETVADVLIIDGKIAAVGPEARSQKPEARMREIDCTGCYVTPGLMDIHVHFREPGQEVKETVATGSRAAVAGGFTTVCCMPNTTPTLDNDTQIDFIYAQAREVGGGAGLCNVLPIGAITKGRKGEELAEMALMHAAGAAGFSDDGAGVGSAAVMLKALQYIKMIGSMLTQHCEEPTLSGGGVMNAGAVAAKLGLTGLPAVAEELMIARDLLLNRRIGARYHVQHISTAGAVELVRQAKREGQPVTAEVTPHHLLLTEEACATWNGGYDSHMKMNPPLRTKADVEACIAGVVDGTIDCLATDHAPHTREEKELEFDKAPFGIVGLETALGLYAKALVEPGHLTWMQLIEKMTVAPARVMNLKGKGTLAVGSAADVTVFDPKASWKVNPEKFYSKSRNTPFGGWELKGVVRKTIVGGRVVFGD
ncbi:MAG: dihydroorotase [Phycisphaerales bacterium]|nr:dihydroorotase [Phycisphaerales bacterium]